MKITKILGVVAVAAMALMAFASTASATTTLATKGVAENAAITLKASAESSILLTDTSHVFANTCTTSNVEGTTTVFTGALVSGPIKDETVGGKTVVGLSFENCTEPPVVVHKAGSLTVENIAGTTNGTVRSIGAEVTVPSPFGLLTCKTAASPGTDIGTLTGVAKGAEGLATMDIKAVLNCGFFLPSALWEGAYTITSPSNLSVEP